MKFRFRQNFAKVQIDRANGLIKGVAVCTVGAAKGHGVLIDDTTLARLEALAAESPDGVRVKFNISTFNHGAGSVIGRLVTGSFKREGEVLRADLEVLKSSPGFDYLFDLAEKQPGTIGLSVEFEGEHEDLSGVKYARPATFDAAAVVDMPAANPTGLFSVGDGSTNNPTTEPTTESAMNAEQLKAALSEALKPINERLSKLEEGPKTDPEETLPADFAAMSEDKKTAEFAAAGVADGDDDKTKAKKVHAYRKQMASPVTQGGLLAILRQGGGVAVPHNGGATVQPGGTKTNAKHAFDAKVDEIAASTTNGDKAAAIRLATKNFPDLHKNWLQAKGIAPAKKTALAN